MVDGKEECSGAERVVAAVGEGEAVPRVAVASGDGVDGDRLAEGVGDEQVEGDDTVATINVGAMEGMANTLSVGQAEMLIPVEGGGSEG